MNSINFCELRKDFSSLFRLTDSFLRTIIEDDNVELEEGVSYVHESFQIFILLRGTVPEDALAEEAPSGAV